MSVSGSADPQPAADVLTPPDPPGAASPVVPAVSKVGTPIVPQNVPVKHAQIAQVTVHFGKVKTANTHEDAETTGFSDHCSA